MGNEQSKNFPGFYNLIHVNANNKSSNRPLDSKYILDKYSDLLKYPNIPSAVIPIFPLRFSAAFIIETGFVKSPPI